MLIITERDYMKWSYWDLVHEWEDELVQALPNSRFFHAKDICIGDYPLFGILGGKLGFNHNTLRLRHKNAFIFEMSDVAKRNIVWNQSSISACIIDFFTGKDNLHTFYKLHDKVRNLYISSREAYDFLLANSPEREVKHLPLTLADKYRISESTRFDKKYDVIIAARQSSDFMKFLQTYEKTHPISYVYRGKVEGGNFPFYNNKGEFVGYGNTREEYINLLRGGRIAFYSTPGINDGKQTGGFHQVTPRFLEEIASGCHVISQYVDNSDTEFFELGRLSKRIENYHDFELAMDEALSTPVDMKAYSDYLAKHYTSTYSDYLSE